MTKELPDQRLDRINEELSRLSLVQLKPDSYIWREVGFAESDFPHQEFHREQVTQYAVVLGWLIGLPHSEIKLVHAASYVHDFGYQFAQAGYLDRRKHQLGSWLKAVKLFENSDFDHEAVGRAALLHVEDVLPSDTPLWIRTVRDADRIGGIGPTGFIRDLYYFGFRDPAFMHRTPQQVMEDGIVCDMRWPTLLKKELANDRGFGYEEKPMEFCLEVAVPWVVENGKVGVVLERLGVWEDRIYGKLKEDGTWKIEPVMVEAQELFADKLQKTRHLKSVLECGCK